MSERTGLGQLLQTGHALAGGVMRLFGAGAILFEAHRLFLQYYSKEWIGIQYAGVNGCIGEDMIANGDLIGGQTFCNKPENFFPWVAVYQNHPVAAAAYYGAALALILVIGFVWHSLQRRRPTDAPFGDVQAPIAPADSEHLR